MPWGEWVGQNLKAGFAKAWYAVDYVISPFKPPARYIYNLWPVASFRHGASSVQYIPGALEQNPKVKAIVGKSFTTNFTNYLVPTVLLYRLGTHVLPHYMPGTFSSDYVENSTKDPSEFTYADMALNIAYYAPLYLIMGRIFLRSLINNISHQATISREMINGKRDRGKDRLARELAKGLWYGEEEEIEIKDEKSAVTTKRKKFIPGTGLRDLLFKEKYRYEGSDDKVRADIGDQERNAFIRFLKKIQKPVDQLFSEAAITETELAAFNISLQEAIVSGVTEVMDEKGEQKKLVANLASVLSKTVVDEFHLRTSRDFKAAAHKAGYEAAVLSLVPQRIKQKKTEGFESKIDSLRDRNRRETSLVFAPASLELSPNSRIYIDRSQAAIINAFQQTQDYLPVKYIDPCPCGTSRLVQGELASGLYYAGNMISLLLPEIINKILTLNPGAYSAMIYATHFLRTLIYGMSMHEYKVAADFRCTRHRFEEYNYYAAFATGAVHVAISEFVALVVKVMAQVDNFWTRDAIENFVMQLITIGVIADPRPLPKPDKVFGVDIFIPGREFTRLLVAGIQRLVTPKDVDNSTRESALEKLKAVLSSSEARVAVKLIFTGNQVTPSREAFQEMGELASSRYEQAVHAFRRPEDQKLQIDAQLIRDTDATRRKLEELLMEAGTEVAATAKPKNMSSSVIIQQCIEEKRQAMELKQAKPKPAIISLSQDTLRTVLTYEAIEDLLRVFNEDIDSGLKAVTKVKNAVETVKPLSNWIPSPLLWLPIPNSVASYLHLVLLILHDESFGTIYARLELTINMLKYLPKPENMPLVEVIVDPRLLDAKVGAPLSAVANDVKVGDAVAHPPQIMDAMMQVDPGRDRVRVVLSSAKLDLEKTAHQDHFGSDLKEGGRVFEEAKQIVIVDGHFGAAANPAAAASAARKPTPIPPPPKKKSGWFPSFSFFNVSGFGRACGAGNGKQSSSGVPLPGSKLN